MLTSGYVADEITIPYRSKGLYEQYPAHSLYKKCTSEFLTPFSFSISQIPANSEINLEGLSFPAAVVRTSKCGQRGKRQHFVQSLILEVDNTISARVH